MQAFGRLRLDVENCIVELVDSGMARRIQEDGQPPRFSALRPRDGLFATIPLKGATDIDASVQIAIMCWPVIDPLGRYEYAKQKIAAGDEKQARQWIKSHDLYWKGGEAEMSEGSPTRILERGDERPEHIPGRLDGAVGELARAYTQMPILGSVPLLENDFVVRRRRRLAWLGWTTACLAAAVIISGSVVYYYVTRAS